MDVHEFERLKRAVALDLARKALENADFSQGLDLLTEEESSAYLWLELLFYDGELSYREFNALCCSRCAARTHVR